MPPPNDSPLWLVGSTVRAVRKARGIRAATFARDVGISPGHLSTIERQRRQVSDTVLLRIAAHLGMLVSDITVNLEELDRLHHGDPPAPIPADDAVGWLLSHIERVPSLTDEQFQLLSGALFRLVSQPVEMAQ